ncbi:MAG: hypothetical protein H7831_13815 [Magnetococcus sp. WYHC-3]
MRDSASTSPVARARWFFLVWTMSWLLCCGWGAGAFAAGGTFSSQVVQVGKTGVEKRWRLYATPDAVRTEGDLDSRPVVKIYHHGRQLTWLILPQEKVYTEVPVVPPRPTLPDAADSPCRTQATMRCDKVGQVMLDGRPALLWRIHVREDGQRESWPLQSEIWVDAALGVAVAERYADGERMRMTHIQEGPQPPELFQVPAGYRQVERAQLKQLLNSGTSPPAAPGDKGR